MSEQVQCDCARNYGKTVEKLGERLERKENRIMRLEREIRQLQKALDFCDG